MNYIWFNTDKSIKKYNIGYLIQESRNVDELYIFTDDPEMDGLECYVRFKRADSLVLGDFTCEYGSYEIPLSSELAQDGRYKNGWKLTINTNVLKVAGQLGITVIFKKTVNNVVFDYAQCYATTIVLKSIAIATELERMLQEFMGQFQSRLTAGNGIIIKGTVISVKLAQEITDANGVPSCDLVKRYVDDSMNNLLEGMNAMLDEINGDVSESQLETPVIYLTNNTLTFNVIPGATGYELYSGDTKLTTITSSPYNLDNIITTIGTYYIKIKAIGVGISASEFSNVVTYDKTSVTIQLNAPVITTPITDNILKWSSVQHATSYKVYNGATLLTTTNGTQYNFSSLPDDTYVFTVVALADGYTTSDPSSSVTFVKTTLVNQYVVTFDLNDENATGDAPASLTVDEGDTVDLTQYDSGFALAGYHFIGWNTDPDAVVGLTDIVVNKNETVYAIWSAYEKLATPTNLVISGTQFQWNAVTNATSYTVYMNDTILGTTTSTFFNFSAYVTNAGTYYFQVKASASGYADSDITAKSDNAKYVKSLPKINAPVISITSGVVSWSAVYITIDGQTYTANYQVYANGTAITGTLSATSYNLVGAFNQSNTYAITVKCVGLSGIYQGSDASNSVNYTYTASTTYTVSFGRADANNGQELAIVISYSGGSITLNGDDDSGEVQLNTTGVEFTIAFYGIAYGNLPIPEEEQFTTHTASISGSGNYTPSTWSDSDNHDATITKTITVSGASSIILVNQGY